MFVDGVELNRMGQNMHLARYPIHWHLIGDGGQGQYIKNSAIHNTYSRCVTVHGTNYLSVENNVTYNNIGHCFFLEDGVEHGNQFCLLYTSDAADERSSVDLGGRRIIKKKR